jgi:hypothetical protein
VFHLIRFNMNLLIFFLQSARITAYGTLI